MVIVSHNGLPQSAVGRRTRKYAVSTDGGTVLTSVGVVDTRTFDVIQSLPSDAPVMSLTPDNRQVYMFDGLGGRIFIVEII